MSEVADLRRRCADLEQRLAETAEVLRALKSGDTVAALEEPASTPALHRATQERLDEREQFLRAVFEGAMDAILVTDASGRYVDANPAACALFGLERERIIGRSILDFAAPDYEVPSKWEAVVREGKMRGEFPLLRSDGTRRDLELSAIANLLPGVHLSVLRDVTERKVAEATLQQNQAVLEHAEAVARVGSWKSGASPADTVSWSAGCARIFGRARDEAPTAIGFAQWIHPEDRAYVIATSERAVAENIPCDTEHRIVLPSGEVRWVRANAVIQGTLHWTGASVTAEPDRLRRSYHVVGVIQDITDRKRAEGELRASEARYRRMIENTSEGVWVFDALGMTTFMNARMAKMLGWTAESVVGQPLVAFLDDEMREIVRQRLERRKEGVSERGELRLKRRDASDLWVSLDSDPLFDHNGVYEGAIALATDITEQRAAMAALRRSEEQLRQAQKMEAIGNLAGGVAHDFNNLLSVVLSYTTLIIDDLKPSDPARADLEEVRKAGVRAADLTRQLLAFGRQQMLQPTILDLNIVIEGIAKMLARLLGENILLSVITATSVGRVHADAGQIEQVITNLAVNARDAMPLGGQLTIETNDTDVADDDVLEHAGVKAGRYVTLAVTDTGSGMDAATKARIFEPFFTTKEKGKGTGLGLATVYGIVRQSGGYIAVHSEPGKGTTFKVYLPRTDRVTTASAPLVAVAAVRGAETILLVEDEEQVRTIVATILRKWGYNVLEAQNGGEALLICENLTQTVHLLLTDVVMPRMSGRELAERLTRLRPHLRVLYVSGYTEDTIVHHGVLEAGIAFLPKPITPDALLHKVREVLDATLASDGQRRPA